MNQSRLKFSAWAARAAVSPARAARLPARAAVIPARAAILGRMQFENSANPIFGTLFHGSN